jgi:hypothetical protein
MTNFFLTTGRVHQAIVTQIHPSSNSVSVEWSERNETKGKEVKKKNFEKKKSN